MLAFLSAAAAAAAVTAAGFKGEKKKPTHTKNPHAQTHKYTPRGVNYANAIMQSNHDSAGIFFFFWRNLDIYFAKGRERKACKQKRAHTT